ncbi:MAG: SlyX family protein [Proteobacteria bacterium]|nr:SlyX family protein [Pseudomonadota bacterium]
MNTTRPVSADQRIIALETRIAYQDHLLASLDEVVQEFTARVESLERTVGELRASLSGLSDAGPADQSPPHY